MHISHPYIFLICSAPSFRRGRPVSRGSGHEETERGLSFPGTTILRSHSAHVLLGHGGMTFAWHDISLKLQIKDCFILERMNSTITLLGMAICFVSSHIIFSVAHPKYV